MPFGKLMLVVNNFAFHIVPTGGCAMGSGAISSGKSLTHFRSVTDAIATIRHTTRQRKLTGESERKQKPLGLVKESVLRRHLAT